MTEKIKEKVIPVIKENFRYGTLNFIFIIAYVNVFQYIFGPENSIVGVIFAILMSASMVRDMTGSPVRNLLLQSVVLMWMAAAAFLVNTLSPAPSFLVNLATLFVILYAFTYEYANHMYFPYILSYLFLIFISPAGAQQMPVRLLAMLAGAVCVILYQFYMGRNRVVVTARDVLCEMLDEVSGAISFILRGEGRLPEPEEVRKKLCGLSAAVYGRRKKSLSVSDAGFNMIDSGRGLEDLYLLIYDRKGEIREKEREVLEKVYDQLGAFRAFLQQENTEIPIPDYAAFCGVNGDSGCTVFYHTLCYIRDRMLHMADPEKRRHYSRSTMSWKVRLQAALDISPVRVIYALRVSLLLACATLFVQLLQLPHGKWLLFTLASVSLPYADDVPEKIKNRIRATVIGGLVSVVLYSLVASGTGRTLIMMLSGYVSFYLTGYAATFSCSTVGALGGAVFTGLFGPEAVGGIFLVRLGYILLGALIGYGINCLAVPYRRTDATRSLWRRYQSVVKALVQICRAENVDTQLYYHLIIQAHMMEDKLSQNASDGGFRHLPEMLANCRSQVRAAHRRHIDGREDALLYETA